jgi:serine/threonine protein kinase
MAAPRNEPQPGSMTQERWRQVKDLTRTSPGVRIVPARRFPQHACSDDSSLRKELESLLAADEGSFSSFLNFSVDVTLPAGTKVGEYQVRMLLGAGGVGEVYRARDLLLGRDVAIKVLPSFLSSNPDRLRRFEQEARAAAALNR